MAVTTPARNQALLRLRDVSVGRLSEIGALPWRDCQPAGHRGQVALVGEGSETRVVKLKGEVAGPYEI